MFRFLIEEAFQIRHIHIIKGIIFRLGYLMKSVASQISLGTNFSLPTILEFLVSKSEGAKFCLIPNLAFLNW